MKNPVPIGVGYLAQYIVKPFLGFCIAKVGFQLSCHRRLNTSTHSHVSV